ncbi:MAG: hypothetical protein HY877_07415 [Deltaproteobacteria bacterium]|nr:hypothetical protein [Deltaproteobacteria bacterium]
MRPNSIFPRIIVSPVLTWAGVTPTETEIVHQILPVAAPVVAAGISILLRNAPSVVVKTGIIGGAVLLVFGAGVGVDWLANQLHNPQRRLEPLTPQEFEYLLQRERYYHPEMPLTSLQSWFLHSYPIMEHQVPIPSGSFFAVNGPVGTLQQTVVGTFTPEEIDYFRKLSIDTQHRLAPLFEGLHNAHVSDDLRRILVPLIFRLPEYQVKREVGEILFQEDGKRPVHRDLYSNLPMWEKTGFDLVHRQYHGLQYFFEALSKSDIPLPEQKGVVRVLIQQITNLFLSARHKQNAIRLLPLVDIADPIQLNPYFIRDGQLLVFQNAKDLAAYLKDLFNDPQTLTASDQPGEKTRYWENGIVVQIRPQNSFPSPETDEDSLRYPLLAQQDRLPAYPPHVYVMIPGYTPQREIGGNEYYIVYIFDLNYRLIQVRISSRSWEEMAQTQFGTNIQFKYMSRGRRDIHIYSPPRL